MNLTDSYWKATLSNGEIVHEENPVPGEPTSWQKLITRLDKEHLTMIGLELNHNGRFVQCPDNAEGYFQAREKVESVLHHINLCNYRGVGVVNGDFVRITWIDDAAQVSEDIRPFTSMKMHTTLRYKEKENV
jgi:hypothetical protein